MPDESNNGLDYSTSITLSHRFVTSLALALLDMQNGMINHVAAKICVSPNETLSSTLNEDGIQSSSHFRR